MIKHLGARIGENAQLNAETDPVQLDSGGAIDIFFVFAEDTIGNSIGDGARNVGVTASSTLTLGQNL